MLQVLRPGYDTRGRTTALSYRSISGGTETERQRVEYTYDDVGNILTYRNNRTSVVRGGMSSSYTVDDNDKFLTGNPDTTN